MTRVLVVDDHGAETIEAHGSAVLRELQLSSRHELTRWARERTERG